MKTVSFCKTTAFACLASLALLGFAAEAQAGPSGLDQSRNKIFINGFRMPSIGLEYQHGALSWHGGMYCTVVSKDANDENETTWFGRAGMTWWPLSFLYVDASYLYGINNDYRGDHAMMLNPGLQYSFHGVVLRLGVAVLASPDHEYKINPTPGIGFGFGI